MVHVTSEQCSWVKLPASLAPRLADKARPTTVLQLVPAPGAAGPAARPCYVAWAGGVAPLGCLAVPACAAAACGLREGGIVSVRPAPELPDADSVSVEPAGEDDWEVLELNPGMVEDQLLGQVRSWGPGEGREAEGSGGEHGGGAQGGGACLPACLRVPRVQAPAAHAEPPQPSCRVQAGVVSPDQTLVVWVRGTLVSLRVVAVNPLAPAARLVRNTELHVAPKPRAPPPPAAALATEAPAASDREGARKDPGWTTLRVLPLAREGTVAFVRRRGMDDDGAPQHAHASERTLRRCGLRGGQEAWVVAPHSGCASSAPAWLRPTGAHTLPPPLPAAGSTGSSSRRHAEPPPPPPPPTPPTHPPLCCCCCVRVQVVAARGGPRGGLGARRTHRAAAVGTVGARCGPLYPRAPAAGAPRAARRRGRQRQRR